MATSASDHLPPSATDGPPGVWTVFMHGGNVIARFRGILYQPHEHSITIGYGRDRLPYVINSWHDTLLFDEIPHGDGHRLARVISVTPLGTPAFRDDLQRSAMQGVHERVSHAIGAVGVSDVKRMLSSGDDEAAGEVVSKSDVFESSGEMLDYLEWLKGGQDGHGRHHA